jgi:apolipoprotein N-acyltransferase
MIHLLLPAFSALLLSLSFCSFKLGILAWCALIPLYAGLENKPLRFHLGAAFLAGAVFWSLTIYWLIHVTLLGQIILILYLALYLGLFGGAVYFSGSLPVYCRLFFLPATWVLLEYLRGYLFTGLPWALVGLSQARNLAVIQIAEITGTWGVSFLVVLVNTALYLYWRRFAGVKIIYLCAGFLALSLGYGFVKLSVYPAKHPHSIPLKVSVVQGNIPQESKWDARAVTFIQDRYRRLSDAAAADKPQLIIWPESSVPGLWGRDEDQFIQVLSLAYKLDTYLLVGAVSYLDQNYFNSALLVGPGGHPAGIYHKLHLVPFGEYVPLKKALPFLETIAPIGDITPGEEHTIFKLDSTEFEKPLRASAQRRAPADPVGPGAAQFGVLICFEDLFPELSRKLVKEGAVFLVNITNDAWYKKSTAAYQHFTASVLRAVENRVYLARAANTGISGFVDPAGRVLGVVADSGGNEIFVTGISTQSIYLTKSKRTLYNRWGDFFILLCLLFDAGAAVYLLNKKR